VTQVRECLPSNCEALSSNPSTEKKERERERDRERAENFKEKLVP
jgi:hypothetical protein